MLFFQMCPYDVVSCTVGYIPTASSARFLLPAGPTKKREFRSDFIRSARNSLNCPLLSTTLSSCSQHRSQVTKTTSSLNLGSNLPLLNALKALPNMSDLTTCMRLAGGGLDSKSTLNSSVLNIASMTRPLSFSLSLSLSTISAPHFFLTKTVSS